MTNTLTLKLTFCIHYSSQKFVYVLNYSQEDKTSSYLWSACNVPIVMGAKIRRENQVSTNTYLTAIVEDSMTLSPSIHFPYYTNELCVLLKERYIRLILEKERYECDNGGKVSSEYWDIFRGEAMW